MFKKAERRQVKLKLAITGPSGAGKTMSALILAGQLGKKVAVIDTENGSASLYADRFEFDTMTLSPPYTTAKYRLAMKAAQEADYEVLVIDSISHAWAGDGGILSRKEQMDTKPGSNSYANWATFTKEHEEFKAAMLNIDMDLICTMRSKQDYVLTQNDRGKQVPQKVGMAPIQRDGMEYEFTVVFDADMTHNVEISKDRSGLFDGKRFVITADTGKAIQEWRSSAKPAEPKAAEPPVAPPQESAPKTENKGPSEAQLRRLFAIAKSSLWTHDQLKDYLKNFFGITSSTELTREQYDHICGLMPTTRPEEVTGSWREPGSDQEEAS